MSHSKNVRLAKSSDQRARAVGKRHPASPAVFADPWLETLDQKTARRKAEEKALTEALAKGAVTRLPTGGEAPKQGRWGFASCHNHFIKD